MSHLSDGYRRSGDPRLAGLAFRQHAIVSVEHFFELTQAADSDAPASEHGASIPSIQDPSTLQETVR